MQSTPIIIEGKPHTVYIHRHAHEYFLQWSAVHLREKTGVMATRAGICKRYCSNQRGKAARGLAWEVSL